MANNAQQKERKLKIARNDGDPNIQNLEDAATKANIQNVQDAAVKVNIQNVQDAAAMANIQGIGDSSLTDNVQAIGVDALKERTQALPTDQLKYTLSELDTESRMESLQDDINQVHEKLDQVKPTKQWMRLDALFSRKDQKKKAARAGESTEDNLQALPTNADEDNKQPVASTALKDNKQPVESGFLKDNKQPVASTALKDNFQALSSRASQDATAALPTQAAPYLQEHAALRFAAGTDAQWVLSTGDSVGGQTVSGNILAIAASTEYWIELDCSVSGKVTARFYDSAYNLLASSTATLTLPGVSTNLAWMVMAVNQADVAKSLHYGITDMESL
jgi:hypothetical protein